jgi:hypothetical protein
MSTEQPQVVEQTEKMLPPKQELFCSYYIENSELFGNATLCYAEAYEYKLDTLSQEEPLDAEQKPTGERSEYDKAYNVCSVEGARLLRSPRIQARLNELLKSMFTDEIADREHMKVMLQNRDLPSKMAAIREFNKLKARITEKIDLTSKGESVSVFKFLTPSASPEKESPASPKT